MALVWSGFASAEVQQTDAAGTLLPQPVGNAEVQLSSQLGWDAERLIYVDREGNNLNPPMVYTDFFPSFVTGDAVTLDGLFKWRGEQIDVVADARIAPGFFSPACGFTGELVLRGGNCNVAFGWYNVADPNNPTPPAASEIYELIPSDTETYMECRTQNGELQPEGTGFCPFGWDNHHPYMFDQPAWIPKTFDSGTIASDPRYLGGHIAFALIGNPEGQCKQTKHSIAAHNVMNPSGQPWITTLIWQSTVDPEGFYVAFEDLPMTQANWQDPGPGQTGQNDGDFNDFVYFITGISCKGGGQPCDTGLVGACSLGRTDCAVEGQPSTCRAIIQPGAELCDNVDNDCNGVVDDGEGLCEAGYACDEGVCVRACGSGEFECDIGTVCRAGVCIEAACGDVECPAGQACRGGACQDPCSGVSCPLNEECQLGRCVDPCEAIECPAGRVCERGLCVSTCECRGCPDGLTCGADGRCGDPACAGVVCEAGFTCRLGTCVDPCENVECPGGAECVNGKCADPSAPTAGETGTGGGLTIDPTDPVVSNTGSTSSSSPPPPNGSAGEPDKLDSGMGCGCRSARDRNASSAFLLAALAVGAAAFRRTARRRKS